MSDLKQDQLSVEMESTIAALSAATGSIGGMNDTISATYNNTPYWGPQIIPSIGTFTTTTTGPNSIGTISPWAPLIAKQNGSIELQGPEADIKVNGVGLMQRLTSIEERLNILRPNIELEAEWDQLRDLGEQYRRLESEFKEKSQMWSKLKAMPKINNE